MADIIMSVRNLCYVVVKIILKVSIWKFLF
jgi:hypothetical protein